MKDLDETRYQKDRKDQARSERGPVFKNGDFKKGFILGAIVIITYYLVMLGIADARNCKEKLETVLTAAEDMHLTKLNWYACNQAICRAAMTNPDSQYLDSLDRAGVEELISVHLQSIQNEMDLYRDLYNADRKSGDWIYATWLCHMVESENQNIAYIIRRLDRNLLSSPAVEKAIATMIHLEGRMVAQTERFNAAVEDYSSYTKHRSLVFWMIRQPANDWHNITSKVGYHSSDRKYLEFWPIEIEDGIMNFK